MPAGSHNFYCEQGATFRRQITAATGGATPVPYDLTIFTPRMQVRPTASSSTIITTPHVTIVNAAAGVFTIFLSSAETALLKPFEYVYDLELYDNAATPEVVRLLKGAFTVDAEVTR